MPDGILSIGAVFQKAQLEGDFTEASEMVKSATEGWSMAFESSKKATRDAALAMQESVRAFAQDVNINAVKAAEGLKNLAGAQNEVRMAARLMKDSTLDASYGITAMASAQEKLAFASAEVAPSLKALAAEAAATATETVVSANGMAAGFAAAALKVRESLGLMQEKLVETAETSKLSTEGMTAGFAGFGSLLGLGIGAAILLHVGDEAANALVELGHLAEKTKMTVKDLSGLHQIAKEMKSDFDPIATGIGRMERNLAESAAPSQALINALNGIHLKLAELKGIGTEAQLQKIATAFAETTNGANQSSAAQALFGRGGQALIPILHAQGAKLTDNIKLKAKDTGVTEEAVAAAQEWIRSMAILSEEFQRFANITIEHIYQIEAAFDAMGAVFQTVFEGIGTAYTSFAKEFGALGKTFYDVMTMNVTALGEDVKNVMHAAVDETKAGVKDIADAWKSVGQLWNKKPVGISEPVDKPDPDSVPGSKGTHHAAIRRDDEALNALKIDHEVTLEEEIAFWQKRLAVVKKGSEEYKDIVAKLAPLMQREDRKRLREAPQPPQTQSENLGLENAKKEDEINPSSTAGQYLAALDAEVKATKAAIKEDIAAVREGAEEKIKFAEQDYQEVEKNSEFEVKMGRMTETQRIAALKAAAAQENQIRQQQSQFIAALDMSAAKKYQQDLARQVEYTKQFAAIIRQLNEQLALDFQKSWKQGLDKMNAEFNADVAKWIVTGQGFEQSMAKLMAGISENFVKNLIRMMEQEILAAIQHKSLMKTQIMNDAKIAAADAFKWASGWGGPIAGAVAAGAAFAGVMAFDSFAEGGVVGGSGRMGVPILAHAGERVLSPAQTANFERMVNHSSSTSSSTTHLHYEPKVSGNNKAEMRSTLRSHADDILDIVRQGYRQGSLSA